jgi:NADH:ubiquinone oxidoreductase subunit 5 (subunit L)/multisubunit Na+/H+ antiporter MnhA subunit
MINNTATIKESSFFILFSLIILVICSIFVGFFFKDVFLGPGLDTINNSFFFSLKSDILLNIEFLDEFYKFYPLLISFCGCFFLFIIIIYIKHINFYKFVFSKDKIDYTFYNFNRFFNQKWFFDLFYKFNFILPLLS